jgi:hypothetical protein
MKELAVMMNPSNWNWCWIEYVEGDFKDDRKEEGRRHFQRWLFLAASSLVTKHLTVKHVSLYEPRQCRNKKQEGHHHGYATHQQAAIRWKTLLTRR